MILLDKGYYDYDFEVTEKRVRWEDTVMSEEETTNMLAMFGMGPKAQKKPETLDEIQGYVINQIKED